MKKMARAMAALRVANIVVKGTEGKARVNHCSLMEVLYYALCGIPGGSLGELTEFPRMVRVMEGHEVFGPLHLRRIDWNQEMFEEEK